MITREQLEAVARRLPYSDDDRMRRAKEEIQDGSWAKRLYKELVEALPPSPEKKYLLEPHVKVVGVPELILYGHVQRGDDGAAWIHFSQGMVTFIYAFARALTSRFVPQGDQENPVYTPDETAFALALVLKSVVSGDNHPRTHSFEVTEWQKDRATDLSVAAERFILMHELAHLHNGDIDVQGSPLENWKQEFAADHFAFRAMLHICARKGWPGHLAYGGIIIFLRAVSLMEQLMNLPPSSTHPPAHERLEALTPTAIRLISQPDLGLPVQLERMISDLSPRILFHAGMLN